MNFDLIEEQKEIQKRFRGWSLLEHHPRVPWEVREVTLMLHEFST